MVLEVFVDLAEEYKNDIPILNILNLFNISKSSYYRWKKRYKEDSELSDYEVLVIEECNSTKFEYRYRNISGKLKLEGSPIGVNTVQRIMKMYSLQCQVKTKRQAHYIGKEAVVTNNILDRDSNAKRPLEKLVTDITYLT